MKMEDRKISARGDSLLGAGRWRAVHWGVMTFGLQLRCALGLTMIP